MPFKLKPYRCIKYGSEDKYSWAVFRTSDIKGLRSPISNLSKIKPLIHGCTKSEANSFVKQLEDEDKK